MNDNTRQQWERYCISHDLVAVDRMVLYGLVHEHTAVDGTTRPGERLLVKLSGAANTTVARSLKRLVETGAVKVVKRFPKAARMADVYAIPWLLNVPANAGTHAPADAGRRTRLQTQAGHLPANSATNAGTPSLLRRESAPAAETAAAADAPDDDPRVCPECYQPTPPGQWRHAHCKPKPPPPIPRPRDWTERRYDDPIQLRPATTEQRKAVDLALADEYATR